VIASVLTGHKSEVFDFPPSTFLYFVILSIKKKKSLQTQCNGFSEVDFSVSA